MTTNTQATARRELLAEHAAFLAGLLGQQLAQGATGWAAETAAELAEVTAALAR